MSELIRGDGITPTALLREWALELELDEWPQAQGALRDSTTDMGGNERDVGHCCLGVACEIGVRHGLVERDKNDYRWIGGGGGEMPLDEALADWADGVLPDGFAAWLGIAADPEVDTTEWCPEHGQSCASEEQGVQAAGECPYRGRLALSSLNDAGARFPEIGRMVMTQIVLPRVAEEIEKEKGKDGGT